MSSEHRIMLYLAPFSQEEYRNHRQLGNFFSFFIFIFYLHAWHLYFDCLSPALGWPLLSSKHLLWILITHDFLRESFFENSFLQSFPHPLNVSFKNKSAYTVPGWMVSFQQGNAVDQILNWEVYFICSQEWLAFLQRLTVYPQFLTTSCT